MKTTIPLSDFLNDGYALEKGQKMYSKDNNTEYIYSNNTTSLGHVCEAMGMSSVPLPHPSTLFVEVDIQILEKNPIETLFVEVDL